MSDVEQAKLEQEVEQQIILSFDSHSRLSEFDRLVYPVVSRRSGGLSLGINLNPDKRCNFDCVYCQVERQEPLPKQEPSLQQLEQELRLWLGQISDRGYRGYPLKDIGLAGDGEPTTVRVLPEVLRLLIQLKQEFQLDPEVKLVLFSNATGLDRKDLEPLWQPFYAANGEVWCKLDFWNQDSLEQLNRTSVPFDRLISKITEFGQGHPLVLQSCLFSWQQQSFELSYYEDYIQLVEQLLNQGVQLKKIQAYTLARQPAEAQAKPWSNTDMDRLAARLRERLPVAVELFYESGSEAGEGA
jgi:wyosine [tRNA(Phe)-imidazoG37] synthetase (radical SAM superfamily)